MFFAKKKVMSSKDIPIASGWALETDGGRTLSSQLTSRKDHFQNIPNLLQGVHELITKIHEFLLLGEHSLKRTSPLKVGQKPRRKFIFQPLIQWLFLVPLKGGRWHIIPQLAVYTTYILPSGGLYATYHLLGEPETTID